MALGSGEMLLVIRANDMASRVLRGLATNLGSMDKAASAAARANINRGQAMIALGAGMTAIGAAGLKWLDDSVNMYAQYDTAARNAFTQVDNGKTSLQDLEKMGLQVAKTIPVSLDDTQKALYDIFSTVDVGTNDANKLLTAFSKAAVAGQTDVETATKGTLRVMNAYKMSAKDVNTANDVMFQLVRKGVGTYADFNTAIGKTAPSAVRAGQSLQTTAGMLAFLTRNGLSASMAATSAARTLDAMSNPKFATNMKKIGLSVVDAQGNFKPMTEIIQEITDKFGNMTAPEKAAALTNLFKGAGNNVQAMRFMNLVVNNDSAFNQLVGDMQHSQGVMGKAYDIMFQSPQSKVQMLTNKYQAMRVEIGEKLLPVKVALMNALSKLLDWWNKLSPGMQTAVVVIAAVASALMVIFGIILMVAGAIIILNTAIGILEIELAPIVVPILLIIAALVALGVAIWAVIKYHKQIWEWMKKIWGDIWGFLKGLWKDISDWAKNLWNSVTGWFKRMWDDIVHGVEAGYHAVIDWFKKLPGEIGGFFEELPNRIMYALGFLIGRVIKWGVDFVRAAITRFEDLVQWFHDLPDRLMKLMEYAAIWLVKKGEDIITGLVNGIVNAYTSVVNWFRALPGRALQWFSDAVSWLHGSGQSMIKGLYNGITSWFENVIEWVRNLPGQILSWVRGAATWLLQTGVDLVQGLWNGIKNAWNNFWNWVKGLLGSFLDGIKHGLGIGSPSKKMMEIGKFTMQGWRLGMESEKTTNMRSALAHAKAVTDAFNNGLQLTSPMIGSYAAAGAYGSGAPGSFGPTGTTAGGRAPIQIDIHTAEINPLQHAAELGALIQNRVG